MQVSVENFLPGRLAVREKEVHPFALHAAFA
jgi:hypothetical protein